MLKALLGRPAESREDLDTLLLYIIAVSFQKMNTRISNKQISEPYFRCLLKQTKFPFIKLSSEAGKINDDELFIQAIPILAPIAKTKIPNLQRAATLQPIEIYNESTYMEFHLLLCELLSNFHISLEELVVLQCDMKANGKYDLETILKALKKVRVFRHYLRTMVTSSAIEMHLQVIQNLLVVDTRKSWTGPPEDIEAFQHLKPFSYCKGKIVLPWESYRDWLKLMVHYFDATQVLAAHIAPLECTFDTISITILSPPLPDKQMLPWTDLLENERYFPTLTGYPSGNDFITFLKTSCQADIPPTKDKIANVSKSALQLQEQVESGSPDSLTKINTLAQQVGQCTSVGRSDVIKKIVDKLVALKSVQLQDRPAAFQTIVDMLATLSKRASFYAKLTKGPLFSGKGFSGKHHCEAYIASLLALLLQLKHLDDINKLLSTLPEEEASQMKAVLVGIRVSHFFIA